LTGKVAEAHAEALRARRPGIYHKHDLRRRFIRLEAKFQLLALLSIQPRATMAVLWKLPR